MFNNKKPNDKPQPKETDKDQLWQPISDEAQESTKGGGPGGTGGTGGGGNFP